MPDQTTKQIQGTEHAHEGLLSDDATLELVVRARTGDRMAVEALLQRCLPPLKRWAHGRLPAVARGYFDTNDLVQEAALHLVKRLDVFEPQHVGALQAYLRQSVINRIRDEIRRMTRQPPPVELPDDEPSDRTSPLEAAIQQETYEHYRQAMAKLGVKDRELIVARIEVQWSLAEIPDPDRRCGENGRDSRDPAPHAQHAENELADGVSRSAVI